MHEPNSVPCLPCGDVQRGMQGTPSSSCPCAIASVETNSLLETSSSFLPRLCFRLSLSLSLSPYLLKTQLFNFLGNMGYMSVKG